MVKLLFTGHVVIILDFITTKDQYKCCRSVFLWYRLGVSKGVCESHYGRTLTVKKKLPPCSGLTLQET